MNLDIQTKTNEKKTQLDLMVIQILLIHLVIIFRGMWILDMLKYHYFGFRLDFENMYASFFKYLIHSE